MAHLSIHLLGGYQVALDGRPLSGFATHKVRALLAYLAVEADRSHSRVHLAGLLWPDWPENQARTYLRQALANLRRLLEDRDSTFLVADRHSIQFNRSADHQLDVADFRQAVALGSGTGSRPLSPLTASHLQDGIRLYQGDFLAQFYLDGCTAFQEWQFLKRERLRRQIVQALGMLTDWYQSQGDLEQALDCARQWVEHEPLLEEGNHRLILLLAHTGRRNAALAHYDRFVTLLAEELEARPSAATTDLAMRIRQDQVVDLSRQVGSEAADVGGESGQNTAPWPPYLSPRPPSAHPQTFVDRQDALGQLEGRLAQALTGDGHTVFIAGDAGEGKTALIREFCRRSAESHAGLLTVGGQCSSHRGAGDPFLPFREILARLTGDLEIPWAAGEIGASQIRRLWQACPITVEALLHYGPELIGSLLPSRPLATRVATLPAPRPVQARLEAFLQRRESVGQDVPAVQPALFEQFTQVLRRVAAAQPLLLWLEDLQWADLDSLALILHLGQRLAGSRILVVGTYRPEEVALIRNGNRHPLNRVLHELQRLAGPTVVNLAAGNGRQFLNALLDAESNRLDGQFRESLFARTEGHPLFCVEILAEMRERGHLFRDAQGVWTATTDLDWDLLPARIEAVIAERLDRVPPDLHRLLSAASVQGEQFSAEVLAHVLKREPRQVIAGLSRQLEQRHRLIAAQGMQPAGPGRLALYRFGHNLFQKYLYDSLSQAERSLLHRETASALETLYTPPAPGGEFDIPYAQIAYHYRQAHVLDKALAYRLDAGRYSLRLGANQEAIAHFRAGFRLREELPDDAVHRQQEFQLHMGLAAALGLVHGMAHAPSGQAYRSALAVARQMESHQDILASLWGLWRFNHVGGRVRTARELAEQFLAMAGHAEDEIHLLEAYHAMGAALYAQAEFVRAEAMLQQSLATAKSQPDATLIAVHGQDPIMANLMFLGLVYWFRGRPDLAEATSRRALDRAEQIGHGFSRAMAHVGLASVYQLQRRPAPALHHATRALELSRTYGFGYWIAYCALLCNWALCLQHPDLQLAARMQEHVRDLEEMDARVWSTRHRAMLAEGYSAVGHGEEALAAAEEGLRIADQTGELLFVAELHRLRGEQLRISDGEAAEACFRTAVQVARRQQAQSLELRAALSLCRLWWGQGKPAQAERELATVYGRFSEGFDTPDLQAASALMRQLTASGSGAPPSPLRI